MSTPSITRILISTGALGLALGAIAPQAFAGEIRSSTVFQDGTTLSIVKADESPLRCGDQDVFYTIALLNANTPLHTVGTSGSYTKVVLPDSIGAFVPVNEVEASSTDGSVRLSAASKLRAPSHLMGLAGSWKAIYTTELPAGTDLKVIETLLNTAGDILGYRVMAPKSPSGELPIVYIKTSLLRAPTQDEQGSPSGSPETPDTTPDNDPDPQASPDQTSDADQVDDSMMEKMDTPDSESPVEIENTTPTKIIDEPTGKPSDESADETNQRTAPHGRISASALEDLEAAFDAARKLTKAELDQTLDELLAEFARTRAQAEDGTSLAQALDQRLEWLRIRIQTRNQRQAIAAVLAAYDANADQLAMDIESWQSGRAYQLVGRMVTSAVYTGEHLPLLYRIQATDPATGASRTIGYVAPTAKQDFRHLLGRVVGIIGSVNNDESLKLTIIEPERIEPMPEPAGESASE